MESPDRGKPEIAPSPTSESRFGRFVGRFGRGQRKPEIATTVSPIDSPPEVRKTPEELKAEILTDLVGLAQMQRVQFIAEAKFSNRWDRTRDYMDDALWNRECYDEETKTHTMTLGIS